jgi:hypothetical protein
MQCRVNDVKVHETPRFLEEEDPTDKTLTIEDPDDPLQTITLRLALRGVTSLLMQRMSPMMNGWQTIANAFI